MKSSRQPLMRQLLQQACLQNLNLWSGKLKELYQLSTIWELLSLLTKMMDLLKSTQDTFRCASLIKLTGSSILGKLKQTGKARKQEGGLEQNILGSSKLSECLVEMTILKSVIMQVRVHHNKLLHMHKSTSKRQRQLLDANQIQNKQHRLKDWTDNVMKTTLITMEIYI